MFNKTTKWGSLVDHGLSLWELRPLVVILSLGYPNNKVNYFNVSGNQLSSLRLRFLGLN